MALEQQVKRDIWKLRGSSTCVQQETTKDLTQVDFSELKNPFVEFNGLTARTLRKFQEDIVTGTFVPDVVVFMVKAKHSTFEIGSFLAYVGNTDEKKQDLKDFMAKEKETLSLVADFCTTQAYDFKKDEIALLKREDWPMRAIERFISPLLRSRNHQKNPELTPIMNLLCEEYKIKAGSVTQGTFVVYDPHITIKSMVEALSCVTAENRNIEPLFFLESFGVDVRRAQVRRYAETYEERRASELKYFGLFSNNIYKRAMELFDDRMIIVDSINKCGLANDAKTAYLMCMMCNMKIRPKVLSNDTVISNQVVDLFKHSQNFAIGLLDNFLPLRLDSLDPTRLFSETFDDRENIVRCFSYNSSGTLKFVRKASSEIKFWFKNVCEENLISYAKMFQTKKKAEPHKVGKIIDHLEPFISWINIADFATDLPTINLLKWTSAAVGQLDYFFTKKSLKRAVKVKDDYDTGCFRREKLVTLMCLCGSWSEKYKYELMMRKNTKNTLSVKKEKQESSALRERFEKLMDYAALYDDNEKVFRMKEYLYFSLSNTFMRTRQYDVAWDALKQATLSFNKMEPGSAKTIEDLDEAALLHSMSGQIAACIEERPEDLRHAVYSFSDAFSCRRSSLDLNGEGITNDLFTMQQNDNIRSQAMKMNQYGSVKQQSESLVRIVKYVMGWRNERYLEALESLAVGTVNGDGNLERGTEIMKEALELARQLYTDASEEVCNFSLRLGQLEKSLGMFEEAEDRMRSAYELCQEVFCHSDENRYQQHLQRFAQPLYELYFDQNDVEAMEELRENCPGLALGFTSKRDSDATTMS